MTRTTSGLLAVAGLLGIGISVFTFGPASSGPFDGSDHGGASNVVDVLDIVADAGTLARADRDLYANTFVASAMAPDGGAATYGFMCEQEPCTWKMGAGTQETITASGNTLAFGTGDVTIPTLHVTQPANTAGITARWFADTGKFFGLFPTTDTTGCGAATDDNGGLRYVSTDQRFYGCDGTTLQRIGFSLSNTASVDFASMADGAQDTRTMTVTGALTTDVATCSPVAAPEAGMGFDYFQVTSADTVSIVAHNHSGGVLDPASLSMKCIVSR